MPHALHQLLARRCVGVHARHDHVVPELGAQPDVAPLILGAWLDQDTRAWGGRRGLGAGVGGRPSECLA